MRYQGNHASVRADVFDMSERKRLTPQHITRDERRPARSAPRLAWEVMADWIFQGNRRHYDLDAAVTASREHWWGTPRYRDRMAVGDRVWLQIVGPKDPGIYYAAIQLPGR